MNVNQMFHTIQ